MTIGTTCIKSIQDCSVEGDAERLSQFTWPLFLKNYHDQGTEPELTRDAYKSPLPAHLRRRHWPPIRGQDRRGTAGLHQLPPPPEPFILRP